MEYPVIVNITCDGNHQTSPSTHLQRLNTTLKSDLKVWRSNLQAYPWAITQYFWANFGEIWLKIGESSWLDELCVLQILTLKTYRRKFKAVLPNPGTRARIFQTKPEKYRPLISNWNWFIIWPRTLKNEPWTIFWLCTEKNIFNELQFRYF